MTEPVSVIPPIAQPVYLDDEIDLRQYILVLINWWREIFLIAFVCAVVAGLAILALRLLPAQYEASAQVAIVRVQSDVNFDERFTTTSDEQTTTTNASARRSALVSLATSDAIAQKVIEQLGDLLKVNERNANALVQRIEVVSTGLSGGRTSDSDLIQIVVQADSPEKAAKIATAWAQIFVKEANSVYGQTTDELLASVEAAQVTAKRDYETIQTALVKFLATSRVDELSRQIARKEQVVKELQTGEQNALNLLLAQVNASRVTVSQAYLQAQAESETTAFSAQRNGQQELLRSYIDAQYQAQIDVFYQQYQRNLQLLTAFNNASVRLQKTLGSAQILQKQIAAGSNLVDGGTVANFQLLKVQTFTDLLERSVPAVNQAQSVSRQVNSVPDASGASASTMLEQVAVGTLATPLQLQINTNQTMSKTVALADMKSLITVIEARLSELAEQITSLNEEMLNGDTYKDLQQKMAEDSTLMQAIKRQEALFIAMSSTQPTVTLFANSVITTAISLPFLNFAELQQIATQYADGNNLLPTALDSFEAELRQLKSEAEQEQASQRDLVQQRDLAWSTFTTVNSKVAELTVSKAAAGSEVRFAAEAIPPSEPLKGPSWLLAVVGGGFAGLLLAALYALVAGSMGQMPFLRRSPA